MARLALRFGVQWLTIPKDRMRVVGGRINY